MESSSLCFLLKGANLISTFIIHTIRMFVVIHECDLRVIRECS